MLLAVVVSCKQPPRAERSHQPAKASASIAPVSLAPRPAGSFVCGPDDCVQVHPRLPDSGEWRCAERGQVVWCAGGETAAGVVSGPPDPRFRCGARWATAPSERVCVDRNPDYPSARGRDFSCRFEQERGITRKCLLTATEPGKPLHPYALPGCWLNQDCRSGRCDRGSCECRADADCELGRCEQGSCVEVER
jgi:hypothetical protein